MTEHPERVAVVGAGLGGIRTIEALRDNGFQGSITLVGAEQHLPYDRPPLSKQVLTGEWEHSRTELVDRAGLSDLDVDFRMGVRAESVIGGRVGLSDGNDIVADATVIASGSIARQLRGQPREMVTLRTLGDSIALKNTLAEKKSLLVIGSGFIGCEIASAALGYGSSVTMIEAMHTPFARTLGDTVGRVNAELIRSSGVELHCGVAVSEFVSRESGVGVRLEDGTEHYADVGVVGIGGQADTAWLSSSPLTIDNGIQCDSVGRAYGATGVWAVGDCAAWLDEVSGRHVRSEHWNSTIAQAKSVASTILGLTPEPLPLAYFWSDQFGMKIQVFGDTNAADTTVELRPPSDQSRYAKGSIFGYFADDRLVAVAGFGAAGQVMKYRKALLDGTSMQDALAMGSLGQRT
ncbi:FAD-dependent oxidoreductase [Rhodococcus fascians]|nr:FAD-dependent oxidoreductase [Rhodococcus fascians]MBY4140919.1 FAD-dependent oxidoreductase [Rhodococcus fascians]MBY4219583.1 FAD-dependent oxidoreductase [Rhodococcus fascians]MBY4221892.1 FAD-dependent oxidoreductase [Rhodococcus fascians]MBY4233893.1 FAD-dependent oxidoreductase [Rhodococcus fascians]